MKNKFTVFIFALIAVCILVYYLPNTPDTWIGGIIGAAVALLLASLTLKKRYGKKKGANNGKAKNKK